MTTPYDGLRDFVAQVPEIVQPLIVAGLGAVPYIEGEGAAALGIIVGINPIVAAIAGAAGNILSVLGVVLLSSRVRTSVLERRRAAAPTPTAPAPAAPGTGTGTTVAPAAESSADAAPDPAEAEAASEDDDTSRRGKGRRRVRALLVRFGVPGASLLAPWALPTQLTAALFIASGVRHGWVMLWQIVAIVLYTGLVAAAATGVLAALGW